MLSKLAFRNMKRSAKDYLVYILTMTLVSALMYAFNSLIFQNELDQYLDGNNMLAMMISLATVFIVIVVAWLINYMVRFMLEKRSSEFGIYLLLGMKKKVVSKLYMRENILLGSVSLGIGIVFGILLWQVLMTVMYTMVQMEYRLHMTFNIGTILMTVLCYAGCYIVALFRCGRKFRKMNINALMNAKRQNEEINEKHEGEKRLLLPLSVIFILLFWTLFGAIDSDVKLARFLIGLVLTIYLFYTGLSAWIICYVRGKGSAVYRGQNLFLLRQFASKVRTMQFTMGTLTALFTLALMGASFALMLNNYQNSALEEKFPFDVQIHSSDVEDDFADEIEIISKNAVPLEFYKYYIYTDKNDQANAWMLTHLRTFGAMYLNDDLKTPNMPKIKDMLENYSTYCTYDTYMGLSDYNHLRKMLGFDKIDLRSDEYAVQTKSRLYDEMLDIEKSLQISDTSGNNYLSYAGIYTIPFSQGGHNGGDYLIIVPDEVLARMTPYYSELVADIDGSVPIDLRDKLDALNNEDPFVFGGYIVPKNANTLCTGSDNIFVYAADNLVRDIIIPEGKYMLASVVIPLFYIGLVFVCVAVTVLSVQQLSDSAKYKFRYDILGKLGLGRVQIHKLIAKQLIAYYLCPAIFAMAISSKMVLFASDRFVTMTGIHASMWEFFAKSVGMFFGIYLVYFVVTYVGFIRNVDENTHNY